MPRPCPRCKKLAWWPSGPTELLGVFKFPLLTPCPRKEVEDVEVGRVAQHVLGPPHLAMHHSQLAGLQNPNCLHSTHKHLTFSRMPTLARLDKGRGLPKVTQRSRFPVSFPPTTDRPSHASIPLGKYSDPGTARIQNLIPKQLHVVTRTPNSDRK